MFFCIQVVFFWATWLLRQSGFWDIRRHSTTFKAVSPADLSTILFPIFSMNLLHVDQDGICWQLVLWLKL